MNNNSEIVLYTVSKITKYIRNIFSNDNIMQDVWVMGEISNFKLHSSGHMYFIMKDKNSQIKCIMFRGNNYNLNFIPKDGMKVKIRGNINIYEKRGEYQLYARIMEEFGKGELYIAFEKLKKKLEADGFFSEEIKKKIPLIPKRFAIITSPTGAAIRDVLTISLRRFNNLNILVVPALVQGNTAAKDISEKIDFINKNIRDIDFIIIGRGGGSIEELWPFNEEIVARSIYNSKIPVISAVGHETDFTISDFTADLRSPTPSAAAEMAIPDKNQLLKNISDLKDKSKRIMMRNYEIKLERLNYIVKNLKYLRPDKNLAQYYQFIDEFVYRLNSKIKNILESYDSKVKKDSQRLDSLNPWAVIKRGYSICRKLPKGNIIKSIEQIEIGNKFEVIVSDGKILSKVDRKEEMK
ncbi:MAG: exodeoxyribonuclease VII large subunit [Candidatus Caldatribacteriota bacterium]|nr:exodeoxyribonuclease VII large subunit [Candidatus Caldatribacteriota bacterium]